jgi:signal recognition particle receptor subunit beta
VYSSYSSNPRKNKFVGKIAAIGQGGSGKTYLITHLANYVAGKDIYNWDEESSMAGTIGVTPYTLDFNDQGKRIVINDNPGQDSLEMVRKILASQGDVYQGLVIVCDSLGWNFRKMGLYQAISLSEFTKFESLNYMPVSVIVTKKDLLETLDRENYIPKIAALFEKTGKSIYNGQEIYYRNRAFNRNGTFKVNLEYSDLIPFTVMEQILTNALDLWVERERVVGFTSMNVRLFVRSFLLGYCEAMRTVIDMDEYPVFASISDPRLVNKLNYHRPTAYETSTGWEKLASELDEPPILNSAFNKDTIQTIIYNFVLASEKAIDKFIDEVKTVGAQHNWKVISYAFTNSVTPRGKEEIKSAIKLLMNDIELQSANAAKTISHEPITPRSLGLDEF